MNKKETLKKLPKIDKIISEKTFEGMNQNILKIASRSVIEELRQGILSGDISDLNNEEIISDISDKYNEISEGTLFKVVNATGVPIHTNLGRSPLPESSINEAKEIVCGYSNLEYDMEKGERGDRYHHAANYLKILTGAEDALVVNNNAAAVFLILNTFAKEREAIVSRGELIEIGGSFRIPDVMAQSGAILKEVGTTNKTRISDYEDAISKDTGIIMKVHKSNYDIVGFSEETSLEEISELASEKGLISYYDAGSGLIEKVFRDAICNDKTLNEQMHMRLNLLSFSGDKMIGGCQAGIIVGDKELIDKLKKNQLLRMLRVDKLTLSVLQSVLRDYISGENNNITSYKMLTEDIREIKARAERLSAQIGCENKVVKTKSTPGGGSCPLSEIESYGVEISIDGIKPVQLERLLRKKRIISRVSDKVVLDVRTVFDKDFEKIKSALEDIK